MLDQDTVKSLSKLQQWRSVVAIGGDWLLMLIPMVLMYHYWNWYVYILVVFWIGARQHGLAILLHESAHYRHCNNKFLNDLISELFIANPLFTSTFSYRESHYGHHRYLNTDKDPDWYLKMSASTKYQWQFPQSKKILIPSLVRDFFGYYAFEILRSLIIKHERKGSLIPITGIFRILPWIKIPYYITLIVILTYFHVWPYFLLLWVIPLFTWASVVLKVRVIAEHFAIDDDRSPCDRIRTVIPTFWDRLFVSSHSVWHHVEHHLYPSIPFYNLPRVYRILREKNYPMHITHSYWGVLKECIKK